jgi:hypothetical protein
MIAIGTNAWFVCSGRGGDKQASPLVQKALWLDYVLGLIFSILAVLGCTGVLPLAVGITFCVFGGIEIILSGLITKCQRNLNSPKSDEITGLRMFT